MYYDWHSPKTGGYASQSIRGWRFFRHFLDYFPIELVKTVDIKPDKNYIFGQVIFIINELLNFVVEFFWKFRVSVISIRVQLKNSLKPIFSVFPHGIMTYGVWGNFIHSPISFDILFPGLKSHPMTLQSMFYIPFRREYMLMLGAYMGLNLRLKVFKFSKVAHDKMSKKLQVLWTSPVNRSAISSDCRTEVIALLLSSVDLRYVD